MKDKYNAKRSVLKPAPPTSSPNTAHGKYISPKTTKILNNSGRYLNGKDSSISNSSTTSSTSSLHKPNIAKENSSECLFEIQGIEPAPGTTYHQIVVYAPLKNPKSKIQIERKNGAVVLRAWPRMRYSQKYSREAGPNPSETSYSYEEFLDIVDELHNTQNDMKLNKEKLRAIKDCSPSVSDKEKLNWVQNNQSYTSNTRDSIIHIFGEQKFHEIVNWAKKGIDMNDDINDENESKDY
jgi:hypothetical protein